MSNTFLLIFTLLLLQFCIQFCGKWFKNIVAQNIWKLNSTSLKISRFYEQCAKTVCYITEYKYLQMSLCISSSTLWDVFILPSEFTSEETAVCQLVIPRSYFISTPFHGRPMPFRSWSDRFLINTWDR